MATQLIPVGQTEAVSEEFDIDAGSAATVSLNNAAGSAIEYGARAMIEMKDPDGLFFEIGELAAGNNRQRAVGIAGPGTFRVRRPDCPVPCGVFRG